MKTLLTFCLVVLGLAGFASTQAAASEATPAALPAVVHENEVDVVVAPHRHYYHRHYYHHRRYYYRHHRRYYY